MRSLASLLCLGLTLIYNVRSSPAPSQIRAPALPYSRVDNKLPMMRASSPQKITSSHHLTSAPIIGQTEIFSETENLYFIVNVTVGTQELVLVVDAGSSDLWMPQEGFICVNLTNATIPEPQCGFASTFHSSPTFEQIPDENFNITYGSGEYINGIVGYDNITLAGLQFRQEIALATLTGWEGNNLTSGVIGFAYPSLTSAYRGTNASNDNFTASSHVIYSSVLNTIFDVDNLTAPIFSFAPSRNPVPGYGFGGFLTIGGIPDIYDPMVNASGVFATTPVVQLDYDDLPNQYTFYGINVSAVVFGNYTEADGLGAASYLVDTGNPLIYVPHDAAVAFGQLYDPPAQNVSGNLVVDCNATAPDFAMVLGGTTFHANPVDMIWNSSNTFGLSGCLAGVQDGGEPGDAFYTFGLPIMMSMLTVFDVGNNQLAFSAREYYEVPDAGVSYK